MYLSFGVLESLNDVRLFDVSCFVHILMMHTLMRFAVDLVELNLLARIGSRKDLHRDGNE